MKKIVTITLAMLTVSAIAAYAATLDGTLDGAYGSPLSVQTTQTGFGDSNNGAIDNANGSELDAAYGYVSGGTLYLFLAGNVESNFNKLDIFFDTVSGGQNVLRADNNGVDYNGLNNMAGLTFDPSFSADYYVGVTNGGGPVTIYANYAVLPTGGSGAGDYLGSSIPGSNGVLSGGTDHGIQVTLNNSNTAGVGNGCGAQSGAGVATGVELAIPLAAIGSPSGCFNVVAFINSGDHTYLSNQVLGALPVGTCNLGAASAVNFGSFAGNQFFQVCQGATPTHQSTWGQLKATYR